MNTRIISGCYNVLCCKEKPIKCRCKMKKLQPVNGNVVFSCGLISHLIKVKSKYSRFLDLYIKLWKNCHKMFYNCFNSWMLSDCNSEGQNDRCKKHMITTHPFWCINEDHHTIAHPQRCRHLIGEVHMAWKKKNHASHFKALNKTIETMTTKKTNKLKCTLVWCCTVH